MQIVIAGKIKLLRPSSPLITEMELDIGRERNFCIACSPQKTKTMQQTKVPKIFANFNTRFAKSLQTFIVQGFGQTDTTLGTNLLT